MRTVDFDKTLDDKALQKWIEKVAEIHQSSTSTVGSSHVNKKLKYLFTFYSNVIYITAFIPPDFIAL